MTYYIYTGYRSDIARRITAAQYNSLPYSKQLDYTRESDTSDDIIDVAVGVGTSLLIDSIFSSDTQSFDSNTTSNDDFGGFGGGDFGGGGSGSDF
jgi:hypothetical protein